MVAVHESGAQLGPHVSGEHHQQSVVNDDVRASELTLQGAVGSAVAKGTRGLAVGAHEAIDAQIARVGANAVARLTVDAAHVWGT